MEHHAHLPRRQPQGHVVALLGHQRRPPAGGARKLAAAAQRQLHVVDRDAERNLLQRQRVAHLDGSLGAAHHGTAHGDAARRQQVALVAVGVGDQRQIGGAVVEELLEHEQLR